MSRLDRSQWATLLDRAEPATFFEVVEEVETADVIDADAEELVEAAIADGPLVEDEDGGAYNVIQLAERGVERPEENLDCRDCGGTVHLANYTEDTIQDAVKAAAVYLCSDCPAQAQRTHRGEAWSEPNWDTLSTEANRASLDKAGVEYETKNTETENSANSSGEEAGSPAADPEVNTTQTPEQNGETADTGEKYLAADDAPRPLDEYEYNGYAYEPDTGEPRVEFDAAITFTASSMGPPFATHIDDAGDWWQPGYDAACVAIQDAIVDALLDDSAEPTNETDETPNSANSTGEEPGSAGANPGDNAAETTEQNGDSDDTGEETDGVDKYRRVYLDAADRAGRETWEYVEEEAIRDALAAIGFEELLDNGTLFEVRPWRFVDTSDDGEDAERRWYYPSGDEPRPDEFRRFDQLLTESAPDDYEPHYFRVARASKDPATQYGGGKSDEARLTVEEAVEWMENGGNVGIAGRPDDQLINVDIDDDEETTPEDVPSSLRARSRSRTGWHTWYFHENGEIPNIPTDEYGEVRADWQYVVAPGSFVASTEEGVPADATEPGYYTVEDEDPVVSIGYDDLPEVFRDVAEAIDETDDSGEETTDEHTDSYEPTETTGDQSAVFEVEAADLVSSRHDPSNRFTSIFHGSDTGANMSVSGDKLHCWRHGVAHGGLQALATLSDVDHARSYGCRELGAAHKNSGAGANKLKGDWRLVWGAWYEAKQRNAIPDDDPIPYNALINLAVADGLVERDELVERDSETGEIVEDPDDDTETYTAFPPGVYTDALDHVDEEYDVDPGRERPTYQPDDSEDSEDHRRDPRELSATVDMRRAWQAAGAVEPGDLDTALDLETTDDGEGWLAPNGDRVGDVARAVALDTGLLDTADDDLDDYPVAYNRAREEYGAPLPRYYTTSDAIAEFDAVLDCIGEVTFWDLDRDALDTEITGEGDEVGGEAVRSLNPAWRDSESEASVLVFESGTVWDADSERVLDALRFCALDAGIIDEPGEPLENSKFTDAYTAARTEYGAPLPRWEPAEDGAREITPQLPPSEELVEAFDYDGVDDDELVVARENVEELIGERLDSGDTPTVVTSLPATGKTTGTIKNARERPLSYLAPRKELQAQALDKADTWGVDAEVLPVFSDESVRDEVLDAAVSHVRETGKDRLRDRWAILGAAFDAIAEDDDTEEDDLDPSDIFTDTDEEDVDLDRPTCETADGEHGVAWALAVHIARRLGYTPREIHTEARGLFGAELPCSHGEGVECAYTTGWETVRDADDCPDLLVGSYIHAHVESVRTYYERGRDGEIERSTRGLVLDEFPGEAFVREFGGEAFDFATWLASSLRDDVEDRRDMYDADLAGDEFVSAWLDGEADEVVDDAIGALSRTKDLLDAQRAAEEILDEVDRGVLKSLRLADALDGVTNDTDAAQAFDDLRAAIDAVDRNQPAAGIASWADSAVREPLARATAEGRGEPDLDAVDDDTLPSEGDLADLLDRAVEAVENTEDGALSTVEAARVALRGGSEGCRRLAAWADDGYAHPDAHHLLTAVVTPSGERGRGERIHTSNWAFDPDATEGTVLDVVETAEKARVVADRNDHGALLHTPPERSNGAGEESPVVGLDATGRAELWSTALGEDVETADIHTTPEERARFLENALSLRVIQAADSPRAYEGDPTSKDTDGDVALLETIAEEYSGIRAPRERGEEAVEVGKPAAITTKGVRGVLEADSRLDDVVAEWENYGNVTGANDLGKHRLAAILGSQHYGDHAIERFCALAGEEVDTDRTGGRGAALDYGSDLANTYLKHMSEDQTMQAILRFARGDSGATVVARTSALREDLPVVGEGQVVETWNDTATTIAREYRRLGREFTAADVRDAVDVSPRQVRRVLSELVRAGYLRRDRRGEGLANVYEPSATTPGAGEVELTDRSEAVATGDEAGQSAHNQYYTWNVRVFGGESLGEPVATPAAPTELGAPPSPALAEASNPPE